MDEKNDKRIINPMEFYNLINSQYAMPNLFAGFGNAMIPNGYIGLSNGFCGLGMRAIPPEILQALNNTKILSEQNKSIIDAANADISQYAGSFKLSIFSSIHNMQNQVYVNLEFLKSQKINLINQGISEKNINDVIRYYDKCQSLLSCIEVTLNTAFAKIDSSIFSPEKSNETAETSTNGNANN